MRLVLLAATGGLAAALLVGAVAQGPLLPHPVARAASTGGVALPLLCAGALALRAARRDATRAALHEKSG